MLSVRVERPPIATGGKYEYRHARRNHRRTEEKTEGKKYICGCRIEHRLSKTGPSSKPSKETDSSGVKLV